MSDLTGLAIGGRYHAIERLGQGGMAVVYRAYDTRLERDVAIKVIRKEAFASELMQSMLQRFEREAKSLARMEHANIVSIYDYGEHHGAPYLVMQYLPGGTLKKQIGTQVSYPDAIRLVLPLARALDYAHQQDVIHRDIKPANILITRQGEPMLSDFGIAKILENQTTTQLTGTGVGIGTPEYMAPEQWTGQVVPQTDIYALALVLYELVTGRKPYTADTPVAVLLQQANEPLPRPRQFVPDLPDSVEQVLFKALAKRPEDRFATMGAFADALEKILQQTPGVKKPDGASAAQATLKREDARTAKTPLVPPRAAMQRPPSGASPRPQRIEPRPPAAQQARPKKKARQGMNWWLLGGMIVFVLAVGGAALIGLVVLGLGLRGDVAEPVAAPPLDIPTTSPNLAATHTSMPTLTPSLPPIPTQGVGSTMVSEMDGMALVFVPEGDFIMGSTEQDVQEALDECLRVYAECPESWYSDEVPQHTVTLDAYWIDAYEVNIEQFGAFMQSISQEVEVVDDEDVYYGGDLIYDLQCTDCELYEDMILYNNGSFSVAPGYEDYPAALVTWYGAQAYCSWAGRRLPTEAEWEKAARGPDGRLFPWGNTLDTSIVNLDSELTLDDVAVPCTPEGCESFMRMSPVGSFPGGISYYGAYDMAGNVWEWVADWYDFYYFEVSPSINPGGPSTGEEKIRKGGSWDVSHMGVRGAHRSGLEPDANYTSLGFRCAMDP